MTEAQILGRLKARQAEYALDALKRPSQRDAFEYGYRAGIVAGLESAIDIILSMLNEERDGDKDL